MDFVELEQNAGNDAFEMEHWWIKTRFLYIDKIIKKLDSTSCNVLEYGCGTGQNLSYLRNKYSNQMFVEKLVGIDKNVPPNYKPNWASGSDEILSSDSNLNKQEFNVVLIMDVLEHIENDVSLLKQWVSSFLPGTKFLITVPAYQHLFSYHDETMGHYRRYTKTSLKSLCASSGLSELKTQYAFGHIYPLVLLIRKLFNRNGNDSDLKKTNKIINSILYTFGIVESKLPRGVGFGTSVVGLFEKT